MSGVDREPTGTPIVRGAEPRVVGALLASSLHDRRWTDCGVALIPGGKSNLTYRVWSDAGEVVLRRPPLGHVLPTAHDMAREYRVLSALHGTAVPVPRTLFLGDQNSELGVQFYVMERTVGHICRDSLPPGYADSPAERAAIGETLVEVLAKLHATEPASVGLQSFGRPEGFLKRQVRRWSEQWERSKTDELPALDALRDALASSLPPTARTSIVHGDYRLDNTMLHPARPGEMVAVLDWELSTLGDPLTDLATLLAYWSEDDDDEVLVRARIAPPVTAAAGFPSRSEVINRYGELTGHEVSGIGWYIAFAFFKLAIICQGITARVAGGAMLGPGFDLPEDIVAALIDAGHRHLESCLIDHRN
jgi:aminoglycoside phosphotransferase (APT) family kinase protein